MARSRKPVTTIRGVITLDDAQVNDVLTVRKAGYRALIAAEPGFGKTISAVALVMDAIETGFLPAQPQILIIAPQSTHQSAWGETLRDKMQVGDVRVVGNKSKTQKAALEDLEWGVPGWYAVTPQLFTRNNVFATVSPDAVIVDEVHQLVRPGSAGNKRLAGYTIKEAEKSLAARSKMRIALSGTPARNKFENLWGVMRFLWPELDDIGDVAQTTFSAWQMQNMDSIYNPFAKTKKSYTTEAVPGSLLGRAPCVIQHYQTRMCCEFHPKGFLPMEKPVEVRSVVQMTNAQRRVLNELEAEAIAWLDDNPLRVSLPIVKQTRIRQAVLAELSVENYIDDKTFETKQRVWIEDDAKSPIADRVEEILDGLGDETAIVFTASKIFAKYLTKRLVKRGDLAREISGDTRATRDADVKGFGTEYRVAVAVIEAVGTGTDGLQKCNNEIWADRSLDRTLNQQAASRLFRRGQKRRVYRTVLFDDLGYAEKRWDRQEKDQAALDKSLILG